MNDKPHGDLIGYARTSTVEQEAGLDAQLAELKALKCRRIFKEQVSSVDIVRRTQLEAAIEFLREGDTLVVTKLDRLARSIRDLVAIIDRIETRGAALRILGMGLDTSTPNGRLMLNVLGSVAQFEREIMLERQRVGIDKAKGEGKYKGRKPTARAKADEVKAMLARGLGAVAVARELGIGRSSVYRILEGG
jgi:DNA invertase Pin-like site-specific DNA recombinase